MSGYDRGFARKIDRSSYDYQYGANPEAYNRGGYGPQGGYRGAYPGRSFIGDEVGSYGSEFGAIGRNQTPREYGRGSFGGYEGSFGGNYGEGFAGGRPQRAFGQGYDRGYGRGGFAQQGGYGQQGGVYGQGGFGGGTFIGAEGGASAGYGRDADDLAGQDERFFGPRRGFGGGMGRGGGYVARGGYDGGFGRGAFGQDYEAGSYGGLPPRASGRGFGRGFGGYGAEYGADMGSYDVDYGGAFMGGVPGYSGGYDAGYGDFGARSGGMVQGYDRGFGGGNARAPFMPEEAYRRHPEYDQPPQRRGMNTEGYGYTGTEDEDLSDEQVLQGVRARLQQDRFLAADRINVEVEDGVVTLTGEVGDFMEARYAWDDAWETPGVHGVINSLTVRTDLPHEPHGDIVPQS